MRVAKVLTMHIPVRIVLLVCLLADSSVSAGEGWEPGVSLQSPRTGPGVTLGADGHIYAIGGVDYGIGDKHATNTAERFHEATGNWEYIEPMWMTRHLPGAVTDSDGRIWVVGGHNAGFVVHDTVERYDPVGGPWMLMGSRLNMARTGHGIAITGNDCIYVFGGTSEYSAAGDLASVEKYDSATGVWTFVASMNEARGTPGYAADGQGRIYAIGGGRIGGPAALSTVERYDPEGDTWEYVASLPEPLGNPAAFVLSGEIYAVGGWQGSSYTDKCYIYSPSTESWRAGPQMYEALGLARGVVGLSSKAYVVGGEGPNIWAKDRVAVLSAAANVPCYSCLGFEPPMDKGAVTVKKNRVLPFKAELIDLDGNPVTDADILSPPVIQVWFDSGQAEDPVDVSEQALSAGQGTDGNQFEFSDGKWRFNLKTKNYTAQGTYTIRMVSGNESEYVIESTCQAMFVIN